jgi:hypothetical protein
MAGSYSSSVAYSGFAPVVAFTSVQLGVRVSHAFRVPFLSVTAEIPAGRQGIRIRFLAGVRDVSVLHRPAIQPLIHWVPRALSPGLSRRAESEHSPTSSAKAKNA